MMLRSYTELFFPGPHQRSRWGATRAGAAAAQTMPASWRAGRQTAAVVRQALDGGGR